MKSKKIIIVVALIILVSLFANINCGKKVNANEKCVNDVVEQFTTNNKNIRITEYEELLEELNKIKNNNIDEIDKVLLNASDSVIEKFFEVEYENIIKAYEQFDQFKLEEKNVILNDGIADYSADVRVEMYKSGYDTKCVVSTRTKYGTEITREIIDEAEDNTPKKIKWFKIGEYSHYKIKPYGKRKFEFKDKSKRKECNIFGIVSTFGYTISENGLETRYIKGDIGKPKVDEGYWDFSEIYVLDNKIEKGKAKKPGDSIKGYISYIFDDNKSLSPDLHLKHEMKITYDTLFPQVMQMRVLEGVVEYEAYDTDSK